MQGWGFSKSKRAFNQGLADLKAGHYAVAYEKLQAALDLELESSTGLESSAGDTLLEVGRPTGQSY